ncbi:acyl-CoA dehydrogenase, N-terminal domain protein [Mycobacterium ulcerans str. Harvey]|uniref:Acyl-CoA dehydrogenase, N-terminal domain protein n=1 Tax=Mycobacterium ulcerans str. Harvey TaxID=1299332 RepID=A0ABP3ARL3_MYCUL|nr:acyl-CoA dehydrogenase, N-terminal domain protein [Mycobacterium ulcerans str. Harvey]
MVQQFVHLEELCRRRIYHSLNPQGVNIVAASILSFGTDEQKLRWAVPILRAQITASLGMSEPSAGSDLAPLRTRAVLDGDHFVVNGQKVWTSGAHDADVLLTFVRTDPDAPKHKGISALLIPTDTAGVVRRPFPSICSADDLDFNEVFFQRREGARRESGWGAQRGMAGGQWIAGARAHHDVAGIRRPVGQSDRRLASGHRTRP